MKNLIVAILLIPVFSIAQLTRIPDANFEQQLINLGYDNALDGGVATANISGVQFLNISNSNISDLSGIHDFVALENLNCMNNNLTSLPINNNINLQVLNCYGNMLNSMDLFNNPLVKHLNCGNNMLLTLDVKDNFLLEELYCSNNSLYALNLSSNPNIVILHCNDNVITDLDLSVNTDLVNLQCEGNLFVELDLSNNVLLESFSCASNQLIELDLFFNEALKNLNITNNFIESLELPSNQLLEILNCSSNKLKQLDVSQNNSLRGLDCSGNALKCLNVRNGNNASFLFFDASSNKDLQCVDVDDPSVANANWSSSVDPGVSFTTFCSSPCSETLLNVNSLDSEFSIYPNPTKDLINIVFANSDQFTVEVYDNFGKLVLITSGNTIDMSPLAVGSYYLKLVSGNYTHVEKVIRN